MICVRVWLGAVAAALVVASPALASGDFGCAPALRLVHGQLTGCDDMAILGPANDTRTNLLLLQLDRHGAPALRSAPVDAQTNWNDLAALFSPPIDPAAATAFAEGEGSRCRTDAEGARRFEAEAAAAGDLPADERARLVAARRGLKPTCTGPGAGKAAVAEAAARARSPAGRAFAAYLTGASAFYEGDFGVASTAFGALAGARSPWLQDAGAYMVVRTEVNRLQVGAFDEYGALLGPEHVDRKVADRGQAGLLAYVRGHPRGAYVGSAQGLLRRVYWLSGQHDRLAAAYAALLAQAPAARGIDMSDVANEIDDKLLSHLAATETSDPTLLAVLDLRAMRTSDTPGEKGEPPLSAAALEAQRPAFVRAPELFAYLQAVHAFYVEHSPARVVQLLPDAAARGGGYLWFSRQALRGMALEALHDRNARGFWMELLPRAVAPLQRPAVELALAMHDERAGALARVFESGSSVKVPAYRRVLLIHVGDAPLLRREAADPAIPAHEREVAQFTLLWKELTRGRYADFAGDVARVPADAPAPKDAGYELTDDAPPAVGIFRRRAPGELDCPAPPAIAAALAATPHASRPRLCLAEFVRVNGMDSPGLDTPPPKDELGGAPTMFAGATYHRLDTYRTVIADSAAPAADKAYALYRAVSCYAPSRANRCGGAEATPAQRKAWFFQLKHDYSASPWAQALHYWW